MCGIAGFLDLERRTGPEDLEAIGRTMAATLTHRGPDASGEWADAEAGVVLAHRRLSIVDLSAAGAQPMVSSCGSCVLSYNGEIYNAGEIRPELEARGRIFKGHSDTEVLVEACAEWGVKAAVERMIGMFAFALWDRRHRTLSLVRDRLGIKPLYYGRQSGKFAFASELKPFEVLPGWRREIDRDALAAYMRLAYVPAPRSIYRDINKLEPGQIAVLDEAGALRIENFWSLQDAALRGQQHPLELGDEEAIDALEALLGDAVRRRLVADVPLGAFLSGGIDSSLIAALMRSHSNSAVRTYSIGFAESGFDEAPHARKVAEHLGTEHTELYVTPREAQEVIPQLPSIYDEPFADSSQVPTYLLSKLTRRHVTVALSGDGGDEVFAGYTRHRFARLSSRMPPAFGRAISSGLSATGPRFWRTVFTTLPEKVRPKLGAEKIEKAAALFRAGETEGYRELVSAWTDPSAIVLGAVETKSAIFNDALGAIIPDPLARMQYLDTVTYLPDDILTKVDRASMAVALEARVPILDHRVVEFSWRLPPRFKMRLGKGKWLLRQLLYRHVPSEMIERPKSGFAMPIALWLRGPLRGWAEDLLSVEKLAAGGYLDPAPIRLRWTEHVEGHRNWHSALWTVLMFQAWRAERGF